MAVPWSKDLHTGSREGLCSCDELIDGLHDGWVRLARRFDVPERVQERDEEARVLLNQQSHVTRWRVVGITPRVEGPVPDRSLLRGEEFEDVRAHTGCRKGLAAAPGCGKSQPSAKAG
jgi:hypothetical protein